jgi:carbamoyltransferase
MTKKVPQSPFYPSPESSPYLGSEMDLKKLQEILGHGGIYYDYLPEREDLIEKVATLLSHGKIIGWVQGKAEFGPRALGNRSILADPRDPGMKEKINSRIKFREFYRPLAPALCEEDGPLFFENYQHSPYMERTLEFKKGMRPWIPAVVHEDGTGRLQTVSKDRNHLFYDLLQSFKMKTDVGVLVNTSLNVMGRPIVHSVEDALTTFFTTGLDYLVIGNYIIKKSNYEI